MKHNRIFATASIIIFTGLFLTCMAGRKFSPTSCAVNDSIHYGGCLIYKGSVSGTGMDKAFAMHSVMKFPQALYVANKLKESSILLTDSLLIRKEELMQDTWSPMLQTFEDSKCFTYADLLRLSLAQSDNNACDLLFKHVGCPKEVETYIHKLGFPDINIKRTEREMAHNRSLATENNCTPNDMARLFSWFYQHKDENDYLAFIWNIMVNCDTGKERLPAIIPHGATIAHKTGTGYALPGKTADRNDCGIIIMPDGSHLAIAVFVPRSKAEHDVADAVLRIISRCQLNLNLSANKLSYCSPTHLSADK